jgi:uncharacterized RDD family membrane protein YckC
LWRRGLALFVDLVLLAYMLAPVLNPLTPQMTRVLTEMIANLRGGQPLAEITPEQHAAILLELLLVYAIHVAVTIAYFTATEAAFGKTAGKWLFSLEVRNHNGGRAAFKQILLRNVLRLVDELPFLYIAGVISILRGPRPERLGDRVAHTAVVVRGSPLTP